MSYVHPKEASKHLKVCESTLRDWAKKGQIEYIITNGGHRRYKIERKEINEKKKYIYARVSSKKQQGDLKRQIKSLQDQYPTFELITDIGSGLNFERSGFKTILEQLFEGNIERVVVAHRDRWCRFGFELFEWIFSKWEAQLVSINEETNKPRGNEFTEDIMSIMGYFHAKYYGKRKYELHEEDSNLSDNKSEESI